MSKEELLEFTGDVIEKLPNAVAFGSLVRMKGLEPIWSCPH